MPYYVGADEPEWDEYLTMAEQGQVGEPPITLFKYVEPWLAKTTVLHFPETPGPRPRDPDARPARELSTEQWMEMYDKEQKALSALALWRLSSMTATCRARGIKRVVGGYDGGGDESFARVRRIEMSDGRVLYDVTRDLNCYQLIEDAAFALLGSHDAGEFLLRGAVIIDFDACTITDERDLDVVFGQQRPAE
jgi:hypothetical protein